MNYIENAIQEIRDWFKDHVAEIKGEDGLQVLYWQKPNTSIYFVKYVLSGNNVFISGDLGEAVYTLTFPATLKELKDCDLHYFTSKLSAFCEERWDFDQKLAKKELDEYWREWEMADRYPDADEIYDGILDAINESATLEMYNAWLIPVYQNTSIDTDDLEYISNFGKRLPYRLIAYWVGLKMAIEKLENKNKF